MGRAGKRPTYTAEQLAQRDRDGIAHISKQFVRYGLTSVHHEGGDLTAIQEVRARGDLHHRVSYEASGRVLDSMIAGGIKTGFGDEWIKFGATSEHTVDGSFSERTMALSTPYPGTTYKGNITETQDDLNAWVERVHRAGIQVNCHANGDVAIDMYLTAVERAQKLAPRADARPKITHCTLINDDLVRRIKAVGAVPAMFTTYAYYNTDKFPFYGEALMKRSMAYRTLLDAGVHAAAGSDFSPGPFAPLMGIQGMVTRTGWDGTTWGAQPAHQRGRGDQGQHHQRRVRVARRIDQGIDHRGQARGLRRARGRSAHGESREDQGHSDRPHGGRRDDGISAVKKKVARATPTTIDEYLAGISPDQRPALERLRKTIRAAAPRAEECISYQLPAFRLDGKMLVWFGATATHCSFYPGAVVQQFKRELASYKTSKGTIRFDPDAPLPVALVKKLVKARIAQRK